MSLPSEGNSRWSDPWGRKQKAPYVDKEQQQKDKELRQKQYNELRAKGYTDEETLEILERGYEK